MGVRRSRMKVCPWASPAKGHGGGKLVRAIVGYRQRFFSRILAGMGTVTRLLRLTLLTGSIGVLPQRVRSRCVASDDARLR